MFKRYLNIDLGYYLFKNIVDGIIILSFWLHAGTSKLLKNRIYKYS